MLSGHVLRLGIRYGRKRNKTAPEGGPTLACVDFLRYLSCRQFYIGCRYRRPFHLRKIECIGGPQCKHHTLALNPENSLPRVVKATYVR